MLPPLRSLSRPPPALRLRLRRLPLPRPRSRPRASFLVLSSVASAVALDGDTLRRRPMGLRLRLLLWLPPCLPPPPAGDPDRSPVGVGEREPDGDDEAAPSSPPALPPCERLRDLRVVGGGGRRREGERRWGGRATQRGKPCTSGRRCSRLCPSPTRAGYMDRGWAGGVGGGGWERRDGREAWCVCGGWQRETMKLQCTQRVTKHIYQGALHGPRAVASRARACTTSHHLNARSMPLQGRPRQAPMRQLKRHCSTPSCWRKRCCCSDRGCSTRLEHDGSSPEPNAHGSGLFMRQAVACRCRCHRARGH